MTAGSGSVTIRAYGSLNDFLPRSRRQVEFTVSPGLPCPAVHAVEASGIPHPEIEMLLVDSVPSLLDARVTDGDRIAVYPENPLAGSGFMLRPRLPSPPAFVLDVHLGKLARILRLTGMDAAWPGSIDDDRLAEISAAQERILLTRDRWLLRRRAVVHGYIVRDLDPLLQAEEVIGRFGLRPFCRPFTRCSRCGSRIAPVEREEILDLLEPLTKLHYDEFWRCTSCGRVYWSGSHLPSLVGLLDRLGIDPGADQDLAGGGPGR
jgi:uncharacterized protein with PIN domain